MPITRENEKSCIEYLKTVDAPTLSNAIELLQIRPRREGFTALDVRAIFPGLGRMVGYAVTAHVETVTEMEPFDLGQFERLHFCHRFNVSGDGVADHAPEAWENGPHVERREAFAPGADLQ